MKDLEQEYSHIFKNRSKKVLEEMCFQMIQKIEEYKKITSSNKFCISSIKQKNTLKKILNPEIDLYSNIYSLHQKNQALSIKIEDLTNKIEQKDKLIDKIGFVSECDTKVRYSTEIEAEFALSKIQTSKNVRQNTPKRKYKCRVCGGWHLTSKLKK